VIAWLPHGRVFAILDPNAFVSDVLPRHFSSSCGLSTFLRRLYKWGFRIIRMKQPDAGAYCHDFFVGDNPGMCRGMKPVKSASKVGQRK